MVLIWVTFEYVFSLLLECINNPRTYCRVRLYRMEQLHKLVKKSSKVYKIVAAIDLN
jgi:hypothetical protein